jgi:hypothetical protein
MPKVDSINYGDLGSEASTTILTMTGKGYSYFEPKGRGQKPTFSFRKTSVYCQPPCTREDFIKHLKEKGLDSRYWSGGSTSPMCNGA